MVVEKLSDWKPFYWPMQVVSAKQYLTDPRFFKLRDAKIINLCRSYGYLSRGYYCSLLAEARQHKVIPSVKTLRDLSSRSTYSLDMEQLDPELERTFRNGVPGHHEGTLEVFILFGWCENPELKDLARQIFDLYRCPLLKVEFRFDKTWRIETIKAVTLSSLPASQEPLFIHALLAHLRRRWLVPKAKIARYDLAILHDPQEQMPPSDRPALRKFLQAGKSLGLDVELIQKKDYPRLAEYDALFIRETTSIEHHTYRFAKKAESEGLVVIDDPISILRCTNKVYLAELLRGTGVPTPKTIILQRGGKIETIEREIPYPVVLKMPDGTFSRGVFKAETRQAVEEITRRLFRDTDIVLAQQYVYTGFDWRVGVLNGRAIFAARYFMYKKHWQIYRHHPQSGTQSGRHETIDVADAPPAVIEAAIAATRHIGNGLYGVDIKETDSGVYVIEVNDNPNIDSGVEDLVLRNELYRIVMREFIRRLDVRNTPPSP